MHNEIAVISDNKRYSSHEQWFDNDNTTVCSFNVTEADERDSGNWTCGISANASNKRITSEIISVNVRKKQLGKFGFDMPIEYEKLVKQHDF